MNYNPHTWMHACLEEYIYTHHFHIHLCFSQNIILCAKFFPIIIILILLVILFLFLLIRLLLFCFFGLNCPVNFFSNTIYVYVYCVYTCMFVLILKIMVNQPEVMTIYSLVLLWKEQC